MLAEQISANLQKIGIWQRLFFMLVYAVLAAIVRTLIWVLIVFQLGSMLITGEVNQNILGFGRSLSAYMYHMFLFLTFNTDDKAFPFAKWSMNMEPSLNNLRPRR